MIENGTYQGTTIITAEANSTPKLEVTYYRDLQPRLSKTLQEVTDILNGN